MLRETTLAAMLAWVISVSLMAQKKANIAITDTLGLQKKLGIELMSKIAVNMQKIAEDRRSARRWEAMSSAAKGLVQAAAGSSSPGLVAAAGVSAAAGSGFEFAAAEMHYQADVRQATVELQKDSAQKISAEEAENQRKLQTLQGQLTEAIQKFMEVLRSVMNAL